MDATVFINLVRARRLDLLGALEGWRFFIPDEVAAEVSYADQATALACALQAGHLRQESITEPGEITLYADLRQRMGKGEAACLAMAQARGWMLGSDDRGRAFRRLVRERIGETRLLDTSEIVRLAGQQGLVSAEEAHRIVAISTS